MPTSIQPIAPGLDPGAVNLARAIRTTESNNNYNARGKSGEFGAYQFMPKEWSSWAGQYLGNPNAEMTPQNQDRVAYSKILDLKNQGFMPGEVASIWNSGGPNPTGKVGINAQGVHYDTPQYVKSVLNKYQQLKAGIEGGQTISNSSTVSSEQTPIEQPKSVGGFIRNIFGSAGNLIGGLANTIFHPIKTLQNIGQAVTHPSEIWDALKQRYGGLSNIEDTLYKDPTGVALDLSALLGGAGLLGKLGTEGSDLARIGELAGKASEVTNPLAVMGQGIGRLGEGIKSIASSTAGLTTGAGKTALTTIEDVFKSGTAQEKSAANLAIAGQDSPEKILNDIQNEQQGLVNQRSTEYKSNLAKIKESEHTLTPQTAKTLRDTFEKQLNELNITRDAKGGLNFDESILSSDARAVKIVEQLDKKITDAVTNPNPTRFDNLKKFSSDAYKPQDPLNTITQPIKRVTRDILDQNVPQYAKMTQAYSQASDLLDEIKDSLGVGGKAKAETVMNKIMSALNENRTNRLGTLEKFNNANLYKARIAGQKLSQFIPGGLAGRAAELGGFGAILHPGPLAGTLLTTSPKLMGLVAKATGLTEGASNKLIQALVRTTGLKPSQITQLLTQVNRQSNFNQ